MTPSDIYALPATRTFPWHLSPRAVSEFLDNDAVGEIPSRQVVGRPGADDLVFEEKLHLGIDPSREVSYLAAVWQGRPIGLLVLWGRIASPHVDRFITDEAGYRAAKVMAESHLDLGMRASSDLRDADEDLPGIDAIFGCKVTVRDGRTFLAMEEHLDAKGRPLFDASALSAAVSRKAIDLYRTSDLDNLGGLSSHRMQAIAAPAMQAALVHGVTSTTDFSLPDGAVRSAIFFAGVLALTDEGTYVISAPRRVEGLDWMKRVHVDRIGGPEMYELHCHEVSAPAP